MISQKKQSLALFDFDGTITTKDTLIEFVKYQAGIVHFFIGLFLISPFIIAFKAKLIPNWKAKEAFFNFFWGGMPVNKLINYAKNFSEIELQKLIRPKAIEKIREHLEKKHRVIIVSASADLWLKYWCEMNSVELISTHLETKDGIITGKISGKNCYGPEKVKRINEFLNLKDFKTIYAYGDSKGDKEMLQIATYSYFRPFRLK